MPKNNLLLFALIFALGGAALAITPAAATNSNGAVTVSDDDGPSAENATPISLTEDGAVPASETTAEPAPTSEPVATENCDGSADGNCLERSERVDAEQNALDEGFADESEVICATGNEPGCETVTNSELWPLYISLGALGATILLVIIINLVSRGKKKRIRAES